MKLNRNKNSNGYCGPNALALLTGQHVDEVTRMLRMVSGKASIKGTHNRYMVAVLEKLGYTATPVNLGEGLPCSPGASVPTGKRTAYPTLAKVLRTALKGRNAAQRYLVVTGHHYVCIQGRKLWDYRDYPEGVFLGECRNRRSRCTGVWAVSLKGDQPVPPPAKPMKWINYYAALRELGLESDGDLVDAPTGYVFSGTGIHCRTTSNTYEETLADIQSILPLVRCLDPDCDMCQPEINEENN